MALRGRPGTAPPGATASGRDNAVRLFAILFHPASRRLALLAAALIPAAVLLALLHFQFRASIPDFCPAYDIDQYQYWQESAVFGAKGFAGGYFGINELPAKIGGGGAHGFAAPLLYGVLARLSGGMRMYSAPLINLALVTLSLAAFLLLMRASAAYALKSVLFLTTYPPFLLFTLTNFQEGFHYAAAFGLARGFSVLTTDDAGTGRPGRKTVVGLFLFLSALSLVRCTWAILFFPYFLLVFGKGMRGKLSAVIAGAVFLAVFYLAFSAFVPAWFNAPQNNVNVFLPLLHGNLSPLLQRMNDNLASLADFRNNLESNLMLLETLLFLLATCLGAAIVHMKGRGTGPERKQCVDIALFNLFNLGALFAVFFLFYTGSGHNAYRLMSAHFVLSFLLTARYFKNRLMYLPILFNILLLPMFLNTFHIFLLPAYGDNAETKERIAAFSAQVAPLAVYLDNSDPWCNTVAEAVEESGILTLGLPAGFGAQKMLRFPVEGFLKSRFLFIPETSTAPTGQDLEFLAATPVGDMYLNRKNPCFRKND